ncbi:MAG: hypothetical protein OXC54_02410 [Rhodospirillaceae bacterium]|nr:hypothetical protein [Rhodospirillaceae bacterium]MCY4239987.1 hypothetical protein [Rhodospirillaceae bacterium]MCY4310158.1 hypothetical protein [Rhodospirillaceae bacterium]
MSRKMLIAIAVALGLTASACGKKGAPRLAQGADEFPAGYPHGAPSVSDNIFQKSRIE